MRNPLLALAVVLALHADAQTNITQLGHLDYQALRSSDLSNLWGYADEQGNEYALVGVNGDVDHAGGLSVVDVTDPSDPHEIAFVASAPSIWREIKVWNDHAYVTTEAQAGLLIVDLSPLPESTDLPSTVFHGNGWITSHSLFIDEHGRLYVNGANRGHGGCIMYDLTQDPMAPVEVGSYDLYYVHDCYARGDTLYAAHINDGFFTVANVSDPAAPVLMGSQSTPNNFTHNCWLDDTGNYLFTTDERSGSFVTAYDVSDPTDIREVDRLQSEPGLGTIPHNTYWLDHFLVTSYYTYGVAIYDATHPDNLVEVGNFDTSPYSGDGFHGAWGVYAFLPSGNLLVSDIEQGLFVLGPTYVHACWLQGHVTDATTSMPVNNATLTLVSAPGSDQTGLDGAYALGTLAPGSYTLSVHAAGYLDQTVEGVVLATGEVTVQDVQLVPAQNVALSLHIQDPMTHVGIAGAAVHLSDPDFTYDLVADANGDLTISPFYVGDYTLTAGAWGWNTVCELPFPVTVATSDRTVELPQGYSDDFYFDLGWTVENTSTTGHWERAVPVGTLFGTAQVAPGADAADDCGDKAFVTGNGGGQPGTDDVDLGLTTLTSPVFDVSAAVDPYVLYQRWFYNSFSSNPANDTLIVSLDNGSTRVPVEKVVLASGPMSAWVAHSVRIQDFLAPTATMRLILTAGDYPEENLMEAGIDAFRVTNDQPNGIAELAGAAQPLIVPNPSTGGFDVRGPWDGARVDVLDLQGRAVLPAQRLFGGTLHVGAQLPAAVYVVRITKADGGVALARAVVQ